MTSPAYDTASTGSFEMAPHEANWLRSFRRSVVTWYTKHGRLLPWRDERDPYRVWIREIMLQQTTVTAVIPYLQRFMQRFPTLRVLANADETDVLHAWEGLGYYSRARNLHRAAQQLMTDHEGEFPREAAILQTLPGIGRYTAGAIASFAFGARAPIVEANTLRLYARLLGYRHSPKASRGQAVLWDFAGQILPQEKPGQFNQALMDLGATICTAENPSCTTGCPLTSQCRAFATSEQHLIPLQTARPAIESTIEVAVVVRSGDRYLLHKRPLGVRWSGLWDFPRYAAGTDPAPEKALTPRDVNRHWREAERRLSAEWNLPVKLSRRLTEIVHHVTRYRIRLLCFVADATISKPVAQPPEAVEHVWIPADQFAEYAMPVSGRKLAKLIAAEASVESAARPLRRKNRASKKRTAET